MASPQFTATIPVVVRKHYPLNVSADSPVPDTHQSYTTVSGDRFPLTVSNDPAIHASACTFKYQTLGGVVTVNEKVVEPLALSISGRWDRSYRFDAGKIWSPYFNEYKPMKTSLDTYVRMCLDLEACPTPEYQFIFGENHNPIHPVLSAAYDRPNEKGERAYTGFPMGGSIMCDNPQLAYEYAWIVLLQLWLHVNNRWLEQRVPTSAGPLHVFILHPQDFEESKNRGDLSKYIALSGEQLARSAGELSASAFISVVTSKLLWNGERSLFDSADPSERIRSTLLFQMRAKGFVPLRYGESIQKCYESAVDIAREQMDRLRGRNEISKMKADAEAAGIITHRAGSLKQKEDITMKTMRVSPGTACALQMKQLCVEGDTIPKPPVVLSHLYFNPTDSVFKYLIRPTMKEFEASDRYECIAWQLPRFLNHTALVKFDSAMVKLLLGKTPSRRIFFTRAAEPDWLCNRSALMRYACFIHEQSVYLVHPYQLGTGKMTELDPFIQRMVDQRMSEFKYVESGALVVSKKRKAGEPESETAIQKSKLVDAYSAVDLKWPLNTRRQSVLSPVSVDIPRLMHIWTLSAYPSRAQCIKLMEPYRTRYCFFYRMLSLYDDRGFNESMVWWVLFHAESIPDHSARNIEHVQTFFVAKAREWDASTRTTLCNQTKYALSLCREWERATLYGFLDRLKDAFHMTEACEDAKSHTMKRINEDFDRMLFVPQLVKAVIRTPEWKITLPDQPDSAPLDLFVDQLCDYFNTGIPPLDFVLSERYISASAPFGESCTRNLAQEIIHVWMYNVKRPIFYYLLFAVAPSFGNLLGDGSTEWRATIPKSVQDVLDRNAQASAAGSTALVLGSSSAAAASASPIISRISANSTLRARPMGGDSKGFTKPLPPYKVLGLEHKIQKRYCAEVRGKNASNFTNLCAVTKEHLTEESRAAFFVAAYVAISEYCKLFKDHPTQRDIQFEEFVISKKALQQEAVRRLLSDDGSGSGAGGGGGTSGSGSAAASAVASAAVTPSSPAATSATGPSDSKSMLLPTEYTNGSYTATSPYYPSASAAAAAPSQASVSDYKFPVSVQTRITELLKMEYEVLQCLTFPGINKVAKEMIKCLPHAHLVHIPKYIARQIKNYNLQFINGYGITDVFISQFAVPQIGAIKYIISYPNRADMQLYYKVVFELLQINCPGEFSVSYPVPSQNLLTAPPPPSELRTITGPVADSIVPAAAVAAAAPYTPTAGSGASQPDMVNDDGEYGKFMYPSSQVPATSFSQAGTEAMTPISLQPIASLMPNTPGRAFSFSLPDTPQRRTRPPG